MHKPKGLHEQELSYFAVFRRVYVQRDEVRQIASIVQRGEREHTFRVGSLVFHAIGQLLPQQMPAFHSPTALFPVGYEASRLYWSTRYANRRCRYLCSIEEQDGRPVFLIRVVEQGHEDLVLSDTSPKGQAHPYSLRPGKGSPQCSPGSARGCVSGQQGGSPLTNAGLGPLVFAKRSLDFLTSGCT